MRRDPSAALTKLFPSSHIGPYKVVNISQADGTKLYLENDNWALLRFSGTEPVLRLTVEADSEAKAEELLHWLRQFVTAENGKSKKSTPASEANVAIRTL